MNKDKDKPKNHGMEQEVAGLKKERDDALEKWEGELNVIARYRADAVTLLQERDEAQAELADLRKALAYTIEERDDARKVAGDLTD